MLLGADPPVTLTRRAVDRLARERSEKLHLVHPGGTVVVREGEGDLHWWTWAGGPGPASGRTDPDRHPQRGGRPGRTVRRLRHPASGGPGPGRLPTRLAAATLAARLADLDRAAAVLAEPTRFVIP
ncbi:hypothetical protein GCM10010429_46360 [Micromonospora olivasterospora]